MYQKDAIGNVDAELSRASKRFLPFNSAHEGYAIIKEELDELWDEIKTNPKNWELIEKEATHVAAMASRFLMDLCGEIRGDDCGLITGEGKDK